MSPFLYLYNMSKWENIINLFNDDPERVSEWFGKDEGEMIIFFIDKGFINQLDKKTFEDYIDLILYYSLEKSENKMEKVKEIADEYLRDVNFEDGRFFLETDTDNIVQLFRDDSRNSNSRHIAKSVFDEDDWEPFDAYPQRSYFFDDCISNLNADVKYMVANNLNDELLDSKIEPETELLESIAERQGHPEYVELSTDIILEIFNDEESTLSIMDGTDLESILSSSYNQAYNDTYTSEIYNQVYSKISNFFNSETLGSKEYSNVTGINGKQYSREFFKIDITNSIYDILNAYLSEWKSNWNDIIYHGDLMGLIIEMLDDYFEEITLRVSDYPNFGDVTKNYNEIVKEYI